MKKRGSTKRIFGFVTKKKLIKEMVDIYVENDTDSSIAHDVKMTYYSVGNANALNSLSSRLGIDLTLYIQERKKAQGRRQF